MTQQMNLTNGRVTDFFAAIAGDELAFDQDQFRFEVSDGWFP